MMKRNIIIELIQVKKKMWTENCNVGNFRYCYTRSSELHAVHTFNFNFLIEMKYKSDLEKYNGSKS